MNGRIRHLINHPFEVRLSDVAMLQDEIDKYPYFPTLRSLLLFALKEFEHESYDSELKKTSIYSPSRVALYHYLQKEKQAPAIQEPEEITIEEPNTVEPENRVEYERAEAVEEKEIAETEIEILSEVKPIPKNQELTFSEWLLLSKSGETAKEKPTEKDIKFQLIEEFIEKSPKISPVKISSEPNPVVKNQPSLEYSDLMTETLAQIYTEQKKYDKAIRAYKILSLKYPEKGDIFSEKIKEIESLRDSK